MIRTGTSLVPQASLPWSPDITHTREDPSHGFDEIVDDGIGRHDGGVLRLLHRTVSGSHQDAPCSYLRGQLHIGPPIAYGERPSRVDAECLDRAIDQPSTRLAALTRSTVRRDVSGRMVRTIVIRVEMGPTRFELSREVGVYALHHGLVEQATRDAGLIGDQDRSEARAIQRADGGHREGKERDASGAIEIADFFDDRAVAIEEDRTVAGRRQRHGMRLTAARTASGATLVMQA
jgi:hypothetical protein